jgi:peptidoglycan/LPS O-acetylase OafA/YrhL
LFAATFFGAVPAFFILGGRHRLRPLLPAAILLVLLSPGVALQSVHTAWDVSAGWLVGTAAGAFAGVASGIWLRRLLG